MRKISLILIVCISYYSEAQHILNGSFEDIIPGNWDYQLGENTYYNCAHNIPCNDFNAYMKNCTAWEEASNEFIECGGHGIFYKNCSFQFSYSNPPVIQWGNIPADGDWYIHILGSISYPNEQDAVVEDGICLDFSEPLQIGKEYLLTYYIKNSAPIPATYANAIHSTYVNIGLSHSSTGFGEWIGSSTTPNDTNWIQQSITFTANTEAKYLSVQAHTPLEIIPYHGTHTHNIYPICLDNFVLSELSSVDEHIVSQSTLYPNPTSNGELYIESVNGHKVMVMDVLGRILHRQDIYPKHKSLIDVKHLEQGNYIIHILEKDGNSIENKKFIKSLN